MLSARLVLFRRASRAAPLLLLLAGCTEPAGPSFDTYLSLGRLEDVMPMPQLLRVGDATTCPPAETPASDWVRIPLPAGEGSIAVPAAAAATTVGFRGRPGRLFTEAAEAPIAVTYDDDIAVARTGTGRLGDRATLAFIEPVLCAVWTGDRFANLIVGTRPVLSPEGRVVGRRPGTPAILQTTSPMGRTVHLTLPRAFAGLRNDSLALARFIRVAQSIAW